MEKDYRQVPTSEIHPFSIEDGNGNVHVSVMHVGTSTNRKFLYITAIIVNLVSFVCGTSLGWTSPEIPLLKNLTNSPLDHVMSASEEGWVGSFLPLAAAIGPLGAAILADQLGRKKSLLISALPFIAAFVINSFATNVWMFYLSRFLCGLSIGLVFTVLPMYIGEISDDEVRGSLGSFMQLFIVIGLLFSYALGPYLPVTTFNIILVVPPVVFLLLFSIFIPETPYYLIKSGRDDDALRALLQLRGNEQSLAQKELEVIKVQVEVDQSNKATFVDIFKSKSTKTALFISLNLVAWQQFSGINIVLFYTQSIFTDAGVPLAPEICTILTGVLQIIASALTPLLVERLGKRILLMQSGIGMGVSQGALALFFYLKDDRGSDVSSIGWLPILCLAVFIVTYCLGFGPLAWAVMGELFPGNVKSTASSATASFCWVLGFFITNYFGLVSEAVGKSGSFGLFAGCCFLSFGFVYKYLPETAGRSFAEIQELLGGQRKM
ncbi:unnamed protein product [Phyllotreta striolata]|uniref:Major facilitator superfamily (MFS) profile domain-containing protein n=1 Tax=Phyllotreta striolata TaxID=444603 RepID=A0A9N9TV13_PHYSR|nr:unnamed protein product [Phyllotreta striolata]